jgi:predicted NBD/HSP70 family sugar kinase
LQAPTGSLVGLRDHNRQLVVRALSRSGMASRADIARITGLSRTTVSSLVSELVGLGLVTEHEHGQATERGAGVGRPPVLLALDRSAGAAVGIDFRHDHIRVAVADLAHTVLAEEDADLDVDSRSAEALDLACELAERAVARSGIARHAILGVGAGLAGPIRLHDRRVCAPAILPDWIGVRPGDELERRLGLDVLVDNDANLGALAEVSFGAARGASHVAYIRAYSGIGAGLIADGRLFRGAGGTAGEIGHVIIDEQGPLCRCGNRGCLETLAGEGAILDQLRRTHGEGLAMADVIALADGGDAACRRAIADAGHHIGVAVANLSNIFDPGLVVVGGSLSAAGDLLLDPLREAAGRYAVGGADAVRIVPGVLGERAEVLGALALVFAEGAGAYPLRVAAAGGAA